MHGEGSSHYQFDDCCGWRDGNDLRNVDEVQSSRSYPPKIFLKLMEWKGGGISDKNLSESKINCLFMPTPEIFKTANVLSDLPRCNRLHPASGVGINRQAISREERLLMPKQNIFPESDRKLCYGYCFPSKCLHIGITVSCPIYHSAKRMEIRGEKTEEVLEINDIQKESSRL